MIDDVPGLSEFWETLPNSHERYIPWESGWFHRSGLLLATNAYLYLSGMQMIEVCPTYNYDVSVGFDVKGTGRYPTPPTMWNNAEMIRSANNLKILTAPRIDPKDRM